MLDRSSKDSKKSPELSVAGPGTKASNEPEDNSSISLLALPGSRIISGLISGSEQNQVEQSEIISDDNAMNKRTSKARTSSRISIGFARRITKTALKTSDDQKRLSSLFETSKGGIAFKITCPSKLTLIGEHGLIDGFPAIVASLDLATCIVFRETTEDEDFRVNFSDVEVEALFHADEINELIDHPPCLTNENVAVYNWENPEFIDVAKTYEEIVGFLQKIPWSKPLTESQLNSNAVYLLLFKGFFSGFLPEIKPFSIKATCEFPPGNGSGSSAGFSSCIAAAFIHYIRLKSINTGYLNKVITKKGYKPIKQVKSDLFLFNEKLKDLISRWCFICENIFHKFNMGPSSRASVRGGFLYFTRKGNKIEVREMSTSVTIDIILVKVVSNRKREEVLNRFHSFTDRYPTISLKVFEAISEIGREIDGILVELECLSRKPKSLEVEVGIEFEHSKLVELIKLTVGLENGMDSYQKELSEFCDMIKNMFKLQSKRLSIGGNGYAVIFTFAETPQTTLVHLLDFLKDGDYVYYRTHIGGSGIVIDNLTI